MENHIIDFFKSEFPKDALDIKDCIELLSQCLTGTLSSIKSDVNTSMENHNYEKLENLTQLLKTIDPIQIILNDYADKLQLEEETENELLEDDQNRIEKSDSIDYDAYRIDSQIPYPLYGNFTHKRPSAFQLFEKQYPANNWAEIFVKTCEILSQRDYKKFNSFVKDKTMQGKKVQYFSKDPKEIRAAKAIPGTDVYIMTNMSANQIRDTIIKMLQKYNIDIQDYVLYLRADYTLLHE